MGNLGKSEEGTNRDVIVILRKYNIHTYMYVLLPDSYFDYCEIETWVSCTMSIHLGICRI